MVLSKTFIELVLNLLSLPTHFDSEDDYRTVVETSVTVNNNSPIQDYFQPDDRLNLLLL